MTRFEISVQPKDGSRHYHLRADIDVVIVPAVGDAIAITDGISTEVSHVTIAPTMDPVVWVQGRSLFPLDAADAKETVDLARKQEGWRVS